MILAGEEHAATRAAAFWRSSAFLYTVIATTTPPPPPSSLLLLLLLVLFLPVGRFSDRRTRCSADPGYKRMTTVRMRDPTVKSVFRLPTLFLAGVQAGRQALRKQHTLACDDLFLFTVIRRIEGGKIHLSAVTNSSDLKLNQTLFQLYIDRMKKQLF